MKSAYRFALSPESSKRPFYEREDYQPLSLDKCAGFRAKSIAEFLRNPERSSCVYNSPKPTRNFSSRHSWSHSILETLIASDNLPEPQVSTAVKSFQRVWFNLKLAVSHSLIQSQSSGTTCIDSKANPNFACMTFPC